MLTLRAEHHPRDPAVPAPSDYYVTEAQAYEVRRTAEHAQIHLINGKEVFPDGVTLFVGPAEQFGTIYVMNPAGKTIDTIR